MVNLCTRWVWVVNATSRPLYPRKRDTVPIIQQNGRAPGPVWISAENLDPLEFDPRIAQLVVSRYTDWAIATHNLQ
jgi:hypothetical protein